MLLNILLVILVLDCVALAGVILMQRSEGGALGMGGGPTGLFTARGAGDLLTRTTWILVFVFFVLSMGITLLAGHNRSGSSVTERLKVNPIDLNALAKSSAEAAPAASSAPTAPPLPGSAPPLPTTAPRPNAAAPLPTTAPRPQARPAPRPIGPILTPHALPTLPPAPRGPVIPRPDLGAPATDTTPAPAPAQPSGGQ